MQSAWHIHCVQQLSSKGRQVRKWVCSYKSKDKLWLLRQASVVFSSVA